MKALVIDDEPRIRRALRVGLEQNGYSVTLAATGEEGLDEAALHPPDVILLDLALPGADGLEVCRRLREWSQVPVIVLSVREGHQDKIAALDMGADDYITKPFHLGELVSRMHAVLRRGGNGEQPAPLEFSTGDLHLDFVRRRVTRGGNEVHLTPTEYELLRYMALNPDRVLTHQQLLAKVWGEEHSEDAHTLRVHIANLRGKIEPDPARPRLLHTEPRIGYRFRVGS